MKQNSQEDTQEKLEALTDVDDGWTMIRIEENSSSCEIFPSIVISSPSVMPCIVPLSDPWNVYSFSPSLVESNSQLIKYVNNTILECLDLITNQANSYKLKTVNLRASQVQNNFNNLALDSNVLNCEYLELTYVPGPEVLRDPFKIIVKYSLEFEPVINSVTIAEIDNCQRLALDEEAIDNSQSNYKMFAIFSGFLMLFRLFHIACYNQSNIQEEPDSLLDAPNCDAVPMLGWGRSFTEIAYEGLKVNRLNLESKYYLNLENFSGNTCIPSADDSVDELNQDLTHQYKPACSI